ncbi:MAG: hypothetical protein AB3N09_08655, partial [Tateyamaria sp.]
TVSPFLIAALNGLVGAGMGGLLGLWSHPRPVVAPVATVEMRRVRATRFHTSAIRQMSFASGGSLFGKMKA